MFGHGEAQTPTSRRVEYLNMMTNPARNYPAGFVVMSDRKMSDRKMNDRNGSNLADCPATANDRKRHIAPFSGRLPLPVDGDPAPRGEESAAEATMTTENPTPSRQRASWTAAGRDPIAAYRCTTWTSLADLLPCNLGSRHNRHNPASSGNGI